MPSSLTSASCASFPRTRASTRSAGSSSDNWVDKMTRGTHITERASREAPHFGAEFLHRFSTPTKGMRTAKPASGLPLRHSNRPTDKRKMFTAAHSGVCRLTQVLSSNRRRPCRLSGEIFCSVSQFEWTTELTRGQLLQSDQKTLSNLFDWRKAFKVGLFGMQPSTYIKEGPKECWDEPVFPR